MRSITFGLRQLGFVQRYISQKRSHYFTRFLDLVQRLYLHNAHVLTVEYLTKAISAFQFTWYLMDQASRIVRM